jgi:hypothetical protein
MMPSSILRPVLKYTRPGATLTDSNGKPFLLPPLIPLTKEYSAFAAMDLNTHNSLEDLVRATAVVTHPCHIDGSAPFHPHGVSWKDADDDIRLFFPVGQFFGLDDEGKTILRRISRKTPACPRRHGSGWYSRMAAKGNSDAFVHSLLGLTQTEIFNNINLQVLLSEGVDIKDPNLVQYISHPRSPMVHTPPLLLSKTTTTMTASL